jgi:hypothetical protein
MVLDPSRAEMRKSRRWGTREELRHLRTLPKYSNSTPPRSKLQPSIQWGSRSWTSILILDRSAPTTRAPVIWVSFRTTLAPIAGRRWRRPSGLISECLDWRRQKHIGHSPHRSRATCRSPAAAIRAEKGSGSTARRPRGTAHGVLDFLRKGDVLMVRESAIIGSLFFAAAAILWFVRR